MAAVWQMAWALGIGTVFFLALRWGLRKIFGRRLGGWLAKLPVVVWLWFLAAMGDAVVTPILWAAPKVYLPFGHPAYTWKTLGIYLGGMSHGQPRIVALTHHIFAARPEPGFAVTQAPWVLIAIAIAWRVLVGPWHLRHTRLRAALTATHGSSRWRLPHEIGDTMRRVSCAAPAQSGVVVGSDGRTAHLTRPEVGNPHTLLLGATRAGKSRRVILPMVWCLGHRQESMILTDPKGELHAHSAAWLRSRGYEVAQIDLLRPTRGNRWNPLNAVTAAWQAGDGEEAGRLAWEIGNTLAFAETGTGTDPIWPQAEESLIAALALGAALEAPEGMRHPATMYRILTKLGGDGYGGRSLDAWFRSLGHEHPATAAYGTAALSESRTRSSIYTGTAAHLRTFGDPGVAWLTAESDHNPADAGRKPMAIFLLLPDEAGARRPIASMYVAQAYSALAGVARKHGGRLPVPVWFLLDEFGNVGKLPGIAEKLTVSAGRNIRFLLAVQSIAQIDHIYGPKVREVLTGNCDTTLFLRAADNDTAQMISTKAGTYTVQTRSTQHRGGWVGGATESAVGRPLLTPDEVLRWPLGAALVLQAGHYPARLPLCDLSKWAAASAAFQPTDLPDARPAPATGAWCPDLEAEAGDAATEEAGAGDAATEEAGAGDAATEEPEAGDAATEEEAGPVEATEESPKREFGSKRASRRGG